MHLSGFIYIMKKKLEKRTKKVSFTCSEEWQIFFRKSVAKNENGHLFCPFLKSGKTFLEKGKLPLHN